MLGVGILPPPSAPPLYLKPTTANNHIHFNLLLRTHRKHLFFCPQLQHSSSYPFLLERIGFSLSAQKKQKGSSFSRVELERPDLEGGFEVDEEDYEEFDEGFDDGDEFDDEDLDDGDDIEDGDLLLPFDKMDSWIKKKPKGFGEGKVYDTSLEDKLLEELEKSRKAQLDNIEQLKNEAKVPKKELKEVEDVPGAVRVRINNLPKKMNIQRDLKAAFNGVHGMMNILPAVSGTKKTRDPVCKGFAFVDFKSVEDANRFVQMFSGQNIAFGKTGKRIKCEVLKSRDTSNDNSLQGGYSGVPGSEEDRVQIDDIGKNVPQSGFWEDDYDQSDEHSDDTDLVRNNKASSLTEQDSTDGVESRMSESLDPLSTKPKEKKAVKKKPVGKKKPDNSSKLKVPGSSKRLKSQDKAKLADVFSRYGVRQAVASKEM